MFVAIIIPPAKKNATIRIAVLASFALSYLCSIVPFAKNLSGGTRTILLTILISSLAAVFRPVKENSEESEENQ